MSRYLLIFVALTVVVAVCTQGAEAQTKPGRCPTIRPGTVGTCVEACINDSSCSGNKKCCGNGCGHVCRSPV
ncbi:hypothetical protein O3G_MSEX006398 [Manduca sexta]|nr:hypothetical protein O3G_MSEX006398 [Manduca sexta]